MALFGTDGLRGRVGAGHITPVFFDRLGRAAASILRNDRQHHPKVLIGRDTRHSGEMLESALQSGLTAGGVDVLLCDVLPTPAVAWLTGMLDCEWGLMITASHNPDCDNGLKIFDSSGLKIDDAVVAVLEKSIEGGAVEAIETDRTGRVERVVDAADKYVAHCMSLVQPGLQLEDLKIVLDCANGATYRVAQQIFAGLAANVVAMGVEPDGHNINRACGTVDIEALQQRVSFERADLGISFDGDGDRLIMVNHLGQAVDGDQLLFVIARDIWSDGDGDRFGVVGTEMSNMGLERVLGKYGIPFARARVGDRHVQQLMAESGWPLGGEPSGHILIRSLASTGDGIVSALRILEIILRNKRSLKDLTSEMIPCFQLLRNVYGDRERLPSGRQTIDLAIEKTRKQLGTGRVLVRPSGTEQLVRVMVEGDNSRQVTEIANYLEAVVYDIIN